MSLQVITAATVLRYCNYEQSFRKTVDWKKGERLSKRSEYLVIKIK